MATSRRDAQRGSGNLAPPTATGEAKPTAPGTVDTRSRVHDGAADSSKNSSKTSGPPRLPPVRLAPREELAASARVAPLLRAARLVACWAAGGQRAGTDEGLLSDAATAAGTGMLTVSGRRAAPGKRVDVLADGSAEEVLAVWNDALTVMLGAEDLDGMATALYTVGGPVRMDALFEAYMAAAGSRERDGRALGADLAAGLSSALEALADLGVVELGTEEAAGGLTVTLPR